MNENNNDFTEYNIPFPTFQRRRRNTQSSANIANIILLLFLSVELTQGFKDPICDIQGQFIQSDRLCKDHIPYSSQELEDHITRRAETHFDMVLKYNKESKTSMTLWSQKMIHFINWNTEELYNQRGSSFISLGDETSENFDGYDMSDSIMVSFSNTFHFESLPQCTLNIRTKATNSGEWVKEFREDPYIISGQECTQVLIQKPLFESRSQPLEIVYVVTSENNLYIVDPYENSLEHSTVCDWNIKLTSVETRLSEEMEETTTTTNYLVYNVIETNIATGSSSILTYHRHIPLIQEKNRLEKVVIIDTETNEFSEDDDNGAYFGDVGDVVYSGDLLFVTRIHRGCIWIYSRLNSWNLVDIVTIPKNIIHTKPIESIDAFFSKEYNVYGLAIGVPDKINTASSRGSIFVYTTGVNNSSTYTEGLLASERMFRLNLEIFDDSSHTHMGQQVKWLDGGKSLLATLPAYFHSIDFQLVSYQTDFGECFDCANVIFGSEIEDYCAVCGGNNSTCIGCDGIVGSGEQFDKCGVCSGSYDSCIFTEEITVLGPLGSSYTINISKKIPFNDSLSVVHVNYELEGPICESLKTTVELSVFPKDSRLLRLYLDEKPCGSSLNSCTFIPERDYPEGILTWRFRRERMDKPTHLDVVIDVKFSTKQCPGCDGILGSKLDIDECGVCGGDSSTCYDCKGVLNGTSIIDECGTCKERDSSPTCLNIYDLEPLTIECGGGASKIVKTESPPFFFPPDDNRNIKWKFLNRTQRHNKVSMSRLSGIITYNVLKIIDCEDYIHFQGRDRYGNIDTGRLEVKVIGCGIMGCDGIKGSGLKINACGICGGSEDGSECKDCVGIINGTHISGGEECLRVIGLDIKEEEEEEEELHHQSVVIVVLICVISVAVLFVVSLVSFGVFTLLRPSRIQKI